MSMNATPLDPLDPPVTPVELAEFLDVETSNPMLEPMLVAATDIVITYIGLDLNQRRWRYVLNAPKPRRPEIAPRPWIGGGWLELPYTNLLSVESVELDGEELGVESYSVDTASRPGRIGINRGLLGGQLVVEYSAGYEGDEVPAAILSAIKILAAWLFEHGGACDATESLAKSGAGMILQGYRVHAVL